MESVDHGVDEPLRESAASTPSSHSRRSTSAHRSSKALRLTPHIAPQSPRLQHADALSASDDQSLTSFPSLSPSLENSPENVISQLQVLPPGPEDVQNTDALETIPQSFHHLFSPGPETEGRSTLFFDAPQDVRDIPGTLHLQTDDHVAHLISRVGAVKLVKRLARDLAQRDGHVTLIQRKAEERELLLRKMLRECEVSNLDIEMRMKELQMSKYQQLEVDRHSVHSTSPNTESRQVSATASIDERLAEALTDSGPENPLPHTIPEISSDEWNRTLRASRSPSRSMASDQRSSRGWKSLFTGGFDTMRKSSNQKLTARMDSPNGLGRRVKGDEYQVLSTKPSRISNLEIPEDTNRLRHDSDASGSSMVNWALKIVGNPNTSHGENRSKPLERGHLTLNNGNHSPTKNEKSRPDGKARTANGNPARVSPRPSVSTGSFGPTGTIRRLPPNQSQPGLAGMNPTHSPQVSVDGRSTNLGPVEMDTILPEDSRPPTLTQTLRTSSSGFLTDNFGFIYDQRRRRRLNEISRNAAMSERKTAVESLQNIRKESDLESEDDAPFEIRPGTATSEDGPTTPDSSSNWQDRLTLSNARAELLSYTPSAKPVTEVTNGESEPAVKTVQNSISMSKRGSMPAISKASKPSTTRAVSDNAEIVTTTFAATGSGDKVQGEPDPVRALVEHLAEVHSHAQRVKTIKWNDFLRKVRADRRRDVASKAEIDQKSRGSLMPETLLTDGEVIGIAGLGVRGKVGKAKGNEFRNLVLAGIPTAYRAKIWAECSGALSFRIPGYYEELTNSAFTDDTIVQQIQMDIPRTLTDNIYYRKGAGVEKLKEVLLAYARRNPDIGYCQGMNLITANLLLIMPTAEDAFWVLTSMIENILPQDYYSPTLLTSRADQIVLRRYVAEVLPLLSNHLDDLGIELEALTFQWFLSVFTDCLSAEALFRVWDVVLCLSDNTIAAPGDAAPVSGTATFLFQVALALLKLNEKSLLECTGPSEIYRYINRGMTDHPISIDNLIRASEGLRRVVRTEDVIERRRQAVEIEVEMTRKRESIRKGKGRAVEADEPASDEIVKAAANEDSTPRGKNNPARLNRQATSNVPESDEEVETYGGLTLRTPMPIDEEAFWRA